jgi:hypothetical protein
MEPACFYCNAPVYTAEIGWFYTIEDDESLVFYHDECAQMIEGLPAITYYIDWLC